MKKTLLKLFQLPNNADQLDPRPLLDAYEDCRVGRSTYKQLDEICILWSWFYVFETGGYIPTPLESKPVDLARYDNMKLAEKKLVGKNTLTKIMKLKGEFADRIGRIRSGNKSDFLWLGKMKRYFTYVGNRDRMNQVGDRLEKYVNVI